MGENHGAAAPNALYGVVLLMAALAFWILQSCIIAAQGTDSVRFAWLAQIMYCAVAVMWLVPDKRVENTLVRHET